MNLDDYELSGCKVVFTRQPGNRHPKYGSANVVLILAKRWGKGPALDDAATQSVLEDHVGITFHDASARGEDEVLLIHLIP